MINRQQIFESTKIEYDKIENQLVKPVCSALDLGWGSLGYWLLGSRKDSRYKYYVCSCNQTI